MEIYQFIVLLAAMSLEMHILPQPVVKLEEGYIEGKTVLFDEYRHIGVIKKVDLFLGVPYAEPPERFSPPKPKDPWDGVLETKSFSPACMQPIYRNFPNVSEDCLYLNVYAPNPRPKNAAVLVYIHGGAFVTGSAMTYMYYGVPLVVVGDVIVVTINYRLGIFSRFSTRTKEFPGNYGLLDQIEALRWVQRNIEAFGGDKNRVTIFGESAGAASVDFLLLSKMSKGLFSQAIMQSGNSFSEWAFKNTPVETDQRRAIRLGAKMGCPTESPEDMMACLRSMEPQSLMRTAGGIYGRYTVFVDGVFLDDTPSNLYGSGKFHRCPLMAGYNRDEGTITPYFRYPGYRGKDHHPFISLKETQKHVKTLLSGMGVFDSNVHHKALEMYTNRTSSWLSGDFFRSFVEVETDVYYACTTDKVLRAHVDSRTGEESEKLYEYIFTHEPTKSFYQFRDIIPSTPWLKAGHAEELLFVFGWPFIDALYYVRGHNVTEEEKALSVQIMRFWTNFAKTGDPNMSNNDEVGKQPGRNIPPWPTFTSEGLELKELSSHFKNGRAARAKRCHFLNENLQQSKGEKSAHLAELESTDVQDVVTHLQK